MPVKTPKRPPRVNEGRPTKYKPEYCEMLIEHMHQGLSYESFAGIIGVSRAVLFDWEKVHPEYLDAKRAGLDKNLVFWEKAGIDGLWVIETDEVTEDGIKRKTTKKLNTPAWIFNMKNRHKWADKQELQVTDGQLEEREKIRRMSDAEIEELVKKKLLEDGKDNVHSV